jgi:hypothetical protein
MIKMEQSLQELYDKKQNDQKGGPEQSTPKV